MTNSKPPNKKMTGAKPVGPKRGRATKPAAASDTDVRMKVTRVKSAKGRKSSSTRWLERQLNDPYVKKAKIAGYRSRAAFKLIELDEKFNLIKQGDVVVDLGAAPGGWSQVVRARNVGKILGIDILPVEAMAGADFIEMDFMDENAPQILMDHLGGPVDLVMSDLAANTTGHKQTDHLKTIALVEAAADFAMQVLRPGGRFVTKVFQGGAQESLLRTLRANFDTVKHAKPKASRAGSPEMYLVAKNYRGTA